MQKFWEGTNQANRANRIAAHGLFCVWLQHYPECEIQYTVLRADTFDSTVFECTCAAKPDS